MKRVFIIHRWSGGPTDDWRPWLKAELEKDGYAVMVPTMPDTDAPVIEKWVAHLAAAVGTPDADTYFVGHSIGCQAILRYLQTCTVPIGGAVFVAGWFNLEHLEDAETERIAHPWTNTSIDFKKIRAVMPHARLIISDNDPFGAYAENVARFKELGAEIIVLHHAGHITAEDGYVALPEAHAAIHAWDA